MGGTRDTKCVELRIRGRVQGVWFRAWMRGEAESLGVAGWVRNEPDGSVRALLCGPAAAVEELTRRSHEGPPLAEVAAVECREVPPPPNLEGFRILG